MKYFILSDIHGSAYYFEKAMVQYDLHQCDQLILLGDLLYHGPRNQLPYGYDVKKLVQILNERKKDILAIKGNCDAEVDEMVLSFPLKKSAILNWDNRKVYMTHGHHLNEETFDFLPENSLVLSGHTHVSGFKKEQGLYFFNPGSISLPKENTANSFAIYEANHLFLYDVTGKILNSFLLQ